MATMQRTAALRALSATATSAAGHGPAPVVVAVTGASGYIGSFVVAELLARGYGVHGLVRGCTKNPAKAAHLLALPGASELLTLFDGGDLSATGSFDAAFAEADAVVHTAAAVVLGKDQSIIRASVDGTANVLASVDMSPRVVRFIHTSSVAAVQAYDKGPGHVFTEKDWNEWSTPARGDAYGVAKTEAEKMVHAHFAGDAHGRTAVAVNPGVVIGPVMAKAHTKASAIFLRDIAFNNKVRRCDAAHDLGLINFTVEAR
jgi:nucleoside-diphosphate-sugar epimerase